MSTTQAIRDALAKRKASPYGIVFTDGWTEFAITALLTELDEVQARVEAAVLAERERCAMICNDMAWMQAKTVNAENKAISDGAGQALIKAYFAIREGVKP